MLDFLGGLIGAGTKFLGGLMGQNQAENAQAANNSIQQAAMRDQLQLRAADATDAQNQFGINRLTLLGAPSSMPSATAVGDNSAGEGVAGAGQDISRAMTAYADKNDKAAQLNNELTQAKINHENANTAGQQLENSRIARTFAQPGSPPGLPTRPKNEIFTHYKGEHGEDYIGLSKDFANTQFGPTSWATGVPLMPYILGNNTVEAAKELWNSRPDVIRNLTMPNVFDAPDFTSPLN